MSHSERRDFSARDGCYVYFMTKIISYFNMNILQQSHPDNYLHRARSRSGSVNLIRSDSGSISSFTIPAWSGFVSLSRSGSVGLAETRLTPWIENHSIWMHFTI